jgi:hypothetical protein
LPFFFFPLLLHHRLSFLLACLPCLPNSPPPSLPPAHLWPFSFIQALFLLSTGICSSLLLACQETPRNEVVAVVRESLSIVWIWISLLCTFVFLSLLACGVCSLLLLSGNAKKRSGSVHRGVIKYRLNLDFSSVQFSFFFFVLSYSVICIFFSPVCARTGDERRFLC